MNKVNFNHQQQYIDLMKQIRLIFYYQDKINKAKKYKRKFLDRVGSDICFYAFDFERQENIYNFCCDNYKEEKYMCCGCKIINFYRLYIRKYSAKKRSILMKLRYKVKEL